MCRRNTTDPLIRIFLDRYHLHLLRIPRENEAVGDIYVYDGKRAFPAGSITHFIEPHFKIPEPTVECLANVSGIVSHRISAKVGLELIEEFLIAMGVGTVVTKVRAGLGTKKTATIRFRFSEITREYIDVTLIGKMLSRHWLTESHGLYAEGYSYYLVTAVARTSSVSIVVERDGARAVGFDLENMEIKNTTTEISIESGSKGEVSFTGRKKLAFGVELYELRFDRKRRMLRLRVPNDAFQLKKTPDWLEEPVQSSSGLLIEPALIGGPEGEVFLPVA